MGRLLRWTGRHMENERRITDQKPVMAGNIRAVDETGSVRGDPTTRADCAPNCPRTVSRSPVVDGDENNRGTSNLEARDVATREFS